MESMPLNTLQDPLPRRPSGRTLSVRRKKSERLERLFELQRPIALKLSKNSLGQVYEVLIEEVDHQGRATGRNSQNRRVEFQSRKRKPGDVTRVRITTARPSLLGGDEEVQ